jgi:hypothetical protein
MGSVGMATQVSDDSYVASKGTETLDMPGVRGGVGFGYVFLSRHSVLDYWIF